MRINTNVAANEAYRNLGKVNSDVQSSMAKLSSGFRINKAGDDAAGLGIANKLRADTRALSQAAKNAEQANSLLAVAEGGLGTVGKILERMKELATQSASDNTDTDGRTRIQAEFVALRSEITRLVDTTKFQGKALLNGGFGNSVDTNVANSDALDAGTGLFEAQISGTAAGTYTFAQAADGELTLDDGNGNTQTVSVVAGRQTVTFDSFGITLELDANFDETAAAGTLDGTAIVVDAGTDGGSFMIGSSGAYSTDDNISLSSLDISVATLGIDADTLATRTGAQTALSNIDDAIGVVNEAIGEVGAAQNRIGYALEAVRTQITNFTAAESVIRDVDMAEEMTKFSKNQILSQAGTAMLAQANQSAQGILQLLRG
ncbi:MAG: flagellin [Gemmatimonadaceae bacterium]|nr:flagellin [Gemmatimonadaceae bacterium]